MSSASREGVGEGMSLALDVQELDGSRVVIALRGRLDAVAAPALMKTIRGIVEGGRVELVCDLSDLEFVDSSGLSAFVSGLAIAREHGGALHVAGANEEVARSFKSTRLDHVFVLYPSVALALRETG